MPLSQLSASVAEDSGLRSAVHHALVWLVGMNAIGVLLALLLLFPAPHALLGEWTYGRWMMVHMNLGLFGWCCLPMLAMLFHAFQVDSSCAHLWARPVVWLWSAGLVLGAWSWLNGASSGKLFLDWSGRARMFFPLAMFALWLLLAVSFVDGLRRKHEQSLPSILIRMLALLCLSLIPAAIYFASGPAVQPHFNPATGGPTGTSQLASSLAIVFLLMLLPLAIAPRRTTRTRTFSLAWTVLALEGLFSAFMNHGDVSHHLPVQYLGLGLMLVWIFLLPLYYREFHWRVETDAWRQAFLYWWIGLVLTGWMTFLPGVLDRFKFTDALVGHSLTAIAGCLTAFLIVVLQQLPGDQARIFSARRSRLAWNHSVLLYVLLMAIAGWIEGGNPAFTMTPSLLRTLLYTLRLLSGMGMLFASVEWLWADWKSQQTSMATPMTRSY